MPNTSRLSYHYPAQSDTANIPSDIQTLAAALDINVTAFAQQATAPSNVQGTIWWCTNSANANYGLNYGDGTSWYRLFGQISVATSDPGTAYSGQVYYNSSNGKLRYYNGTAWSVSYTHLTLPTKA